MHIQDCVKIKTNILTYTLHKNLKLSYKKLTKNTSNWLRSIKIISQKQRIVSSRGLEQKIKIGKQLKSQPKLEQGKNLLRLGKDEKWVENKNTKMKSVQ